MGFWVVFSDSPAFSASIALFFVPKDPLGPDFGPKHNFKNNLKTGLRRVRARGTPLGPCDVETQGRLCAR